MKKTLISQHFMLLFFVGSFPTISLAHDYNNKIKRVCEDNFLSIIKYDPSNKEFFNSPSLSQTAYMRSILINPANLSDIKNNKLLLSEFNLTLRIQGESIDINTKFFDTIKNIIDLSFDNALKSDLYHTFNENIVLGTNNKYVFIKTITITLNNGTQYALNQRTFDKNINKWKLGIEKYDGIFWEYKNQKYEKVKNLKETFDDTKNKCTQFFIDYAIPGIFMDLEKNTIETGYYEIGVSYNESASPRFSISHRNFRKITADSGTETERTHAEEILKQAKEGKIITQENETDISMIIDNTLKKEKNNFLDTQLTCINQKEYINNFEKNLQNYLNIKESENTTVERLKYWKNKKNEITSNKLLSNETKKKLEQILEKYEDIYTEKTFAEDLKNALNIEKSNNDVSQLMEEFKSQKDKIESNKSLSSDSKQKLLLLLMQRGVTTITSILNKIRNLTYEQIKNSKGLSDYKRFCAHQSISELEEFRQLIEKQAKEKIEIPILFRFELLSKLNDAIKNGIEEDLKKSDITKQTLHQLRIINSETINNFDLNKKLTELFNSKLLEEEEKKKRKREEEELEKNKKVKKETNPNNNINISTNYKKNSTVQSQRTSA